MGLGEVLEDKHGKKVESKRHRGAGSTGEELIRVREVEGTVKQSRSPSRF